MSTQWDEYGFGDKILSILKEVAASSTGHHLGTPFVTAYQIAIAFNREYEDVVRKLGYQVGGKGIGVRTSLAQYIGRQLSQAIKSGKLADIEGAFLSRHDLRAMTFTNGVESSAEGGVDISMYRLKTAI